MRFNDIFWESENDGMDCGDYLRPGYFNKISRIGQVLKRYSQSVGKHGWHMGYTGDIIAGSDRKSWGIQP